MNSTDPSGPTVVELPDGTRCEIAVEDEEVRYEVEPGQEGQAVQANYYSPDQARQQADSIRDREARSWDTVFPEQAGPVLDVAQALERAANRVEADR